MEDSRKQSLKDFPMITTKVFPKEFLIQISKLSPENCIRRSLLSFQEESQEDSRKI